MALVGANPDGLLCFFASFFRWGLSMDLRRCMSVICEYIGEGM